MKHIVEENKSFDVDIHRIIDDAMTKKDRSVSIFITSTSTMINVNPYENDKTTWKVHKHPAKNKYLHFCGNCNREADQPYPYCPWCGEELGFSDSDLEEALKIKKSEGE